MPNTRHETNHCVNEEISFVDLHDKTIASLHTLKDVCRALQFKVVTTSRVKVKPVLPDSFSRTQITQSVFISCNFCRSVPSLIFVVLLKCSFAVSSDYFYISLNLVAIFLCLNLTVFRETVLLTICQMNSFAFPYQLPSSEIS